jgi:hypothetical protein
MNDTNYDAAIRPEKPYSFAPRPKKPNVPGRTWSRAPRGMKVSPFRPDPITPTGPGRRWSRAPGGLLVAPGRPVLVPMPGGPPPTVPVAIAGHDPIRVATEKRWSDGKAYQW